MPSEGPQFNPTPQHHSLEILKKKYKERLDSILYKQLTVENIETFANEALTETISLTDDILVEYRGNPNLKASPAAPNAQAQDDKAFAIFGLPNIDEILQKIIEVKNKIDSLKTYINTNVENINKVITPPQPNNGTKISGGNGNLERKKIFPRLLTLLYILEHDFEISPTDVKIREGITTPNMMRKTPYVRIEISELNRVIYICNEEDNASYVFDTAKLAKAKLTLEEVDLYDKEEKNLLITHYPSIGIRVIQSISWRERISGILEKTIPEIQIELTQQHEGEKKSEFEKPKWSPFEEFQTEARKLYPGQGDVQKWYRKERKNHSNWPSVPYKTYKNKGWQGWPELVVKENFLKKEYLSFEDFQIELKKLYPGQGDVQKWYYKERKNHPGWPSRPAKQYGSDGWIGWPELVEKENRLKKEYLSFENLQAEARKLYPGRGDVQKWYRQKQKKHLNWPFNPYEKYKNDGWEGWSELVGIKNRLKKKE